MLAAVSIRCSVGSNDKLPAFETSLAEADINTSSIGNGRNANRRNIHISKACMGVLASLIPSRACTTIS